MFRIIHIIFFGLSVISLISGKSVNHKSWAENVVQSEDNIVKAGRIVSIPVKTYREAFKATLSLGQCPLVREENGSLKTCAAKFSGSEVYIARSGMTVDVHRVQSSDDVLRHIVVGFGGSVGVLGLASISTKITVAVTTLTSNTNLNLLSSYELQKGVITLHSPKPIGIIQDSTLFLSEIEIGGNEAMLVTLEFESVERKVEVQISITFKVLFISMTAKLKFVHRHFKSKAKVRIQFKSSWRKELDEFYSDLGSALPRVEEIENMYMSGPQVLRDMTNDDEKSHNFYHFSSWKETPYGKHFNLALINHDLEFLTEQNTEMRSVLDRLDALLKKKSWNKDQLTQLNNLNATLTEKTQELTKGLNRYHTLCDTERQELRDLYGKDKAPLHYIRKFNSILGE